MPDTDVATFTVADQFARDIDGHKLTVLHDDGLYRHLRFAQPKSSFYWFDLITWPGHLVIAGDMGGHVFARTKDMFEFFRDSRAINPGYWAEKIVSGTQGVKAYSEERFRQIVTEEAEDAEDEWPGLTAAVKAEILDDEWVDTYYDQTARDALDAFRFKPVADGPEFRFQDTWEWNFDDWDYRYLWRCHAILWGIGQYDTRPAVADV